MIHHKKLIVTFCLTATVVFAATASMQQQEEKHEWKNLKVLPKNISEKELDHVMDEWRDALGVKCGFCHARDAATGKNDFASDAKPEKEMARKMYTMTAKINKKWFKEDKSDKNSKDMLAAITCFACHHGAAHPETTAPPRAPRGQGGPGQGQRPAQQQTPPAGTTPPASTTPPSK
ncbi:MAG: c-type cytochrome [Mucilaginibacter sp.]|uniref:c-type cytochrome n=1 Tax=Mucilaginibacter sp. TaxID=1882438 RepID=UPI003262D785